jgi:hypothetical protein
MSALRFHFLKLTFFWGVMAFSSVKFTRVSEELPTFIFQAEE